MTTLRATLITFAILSLLAFSPNQKERDLVGKWQVTKVDNPELNQKVEKLSASTREQVLAKIQKIYLQTVISLDDNGVYEQHAAHRLEKGRWQYDKKEKTLTLKIEAGSSNTLNVLELDSKTLVLFNPTDSVTTYYKRIK